MITPLIVHNGLIYIAGQGANSNGPVGKDDIDSHTTKVMENVKQLVEVGGGTMDSILQLTVFLADLAHYDAMNKGTQAASGEWINFMNAGDRFHDANLVGRIFAHDRSSYGLVYGNVEVNYDGKFSTIQKAGRVEELWKGMIFCHQSLFTRTALLREEGFNVDNAIGADFEVIYRLENLGHRFAYTDETVATVQAFGLSDIDRVRSIRSHWRVVSTHRSSLKVTLYYLWEIAVEVARGVVKSLLPRAVVDKITRLKL